MNATSVRVVVRNVLAGCARTVLITLVCLLGWSVLPLAVGWQPNVVMTGSMEPAIMTGDVVVTRQVPADQLRVGHVLLVDGPLQDGRTLLHRYDRATDTGDLVLRGDANDDVDSTPVAIEHVRGVGTLRIPWVGQLAVWVTHGQFFPLALALFGLVALLGLARIPEESKDDTDDDPTVPSRPDIETSRTATAPVASVRAAVVIASALLVGLTIPAYAAFASTTQTTTHFSAADHFGPTAPEWVQPEGSHDAYNIGDEVTFEGAVYRSTIDANAWSPAIYPAGWERIA